MAVPPCEMSPFATMPVVHRIITFGTKLLCCAAWFTRSMPMPAIIFSNHSYSKCMVSNHSNNYHFSSLCANKNLVFSRRAISQNAIVRRAHSIRSCC